MNNTTCSPKTNKVAPVAQSNREVSAEDLLRDVAYALKLARKISSEIRREAVVPERIAARAQMTPVGV